MLSKEMIENIKHTVVENMTDDEVNSVITIRNIEDGRREENEFDGIIKFGIKMPKEGRIAFETVEPLIPTIMNEIMEIKGNPKDILDTGIYDDLLTTKDKEWAKNVEELMSEEEVKLRKKMIKEIEAVQKKGLKWNRQVCWAIWKICRGRKQEEWLKKQSIDIEFMIELYSHFSNLQNQQIRNRYKARFI